MLRQINKLIAPSSKLIGKDFLFCVLSSLLLVFSFPNFNLWPLAWVGFVPLFFALNNKSQKETFFLFFITGIIFWSGIIYWLVHVTFFGTIILILYLALYFAIFGLIIRPCTKHSTPYALLFIPSAWVLLEYLRAHLMTGFPWALLGYSQYLNLPVIQIADITGAWGVSFLLMFINVAIGEIIWSVIGGLRVRLKIIIIWAALLLSLTLYYGYFRLSGRPMPGSQHPILISVVQGNIPQELKWLPDAKERILDKYAKITEEAARTKPSLIVWPEASSPGFLGEDPVTFQHIFSLASDIKIPILLGCVVSDYGRYFNSALLVDASGQIIGRYDKLHLVPFGEYIPLKKIFPFLETVVPIGDIQRGKEYTIFEIPNLKPGIPSKFAVLICFEDLFCDISREFVKKGAGFLLNITNDAWYKKTSAPYQHLQASVFRAVENRVYLARAANTGVSAFINPYGKVIARLKDALGQDIFVGGYLTGQISIFPSVGTFYNRYGDVFVFICFLFFLYGIMRLFKN